METCDGDQKPAIAPIDRHANDATADDIVAIYRRFLGRDLATPDVMARYVGRPIVDVAMEIAASREFQIRSPISEQDIQELCRLFLGAAADDFWVSELAQMLGYFQVAPAALMDNLLRMHLRRRGIRAVDDAQNFSQPPHVHLRAQADYVPTPRFGREITLVVPTINSANWIEHLVAFYDGIGVQPLYAVDGRTNDNTREILARREKNWIEVAAEAERIEALLPAILRQIDTPWVLRLDDDELPSPELLRFADATAAVAEVPMWGFPRLALRWHPGREELAYSRFLAFDRYFDLDRQWRLFRPADVRLGTELHTPGIVGEKQARATPGAFILHFDWVLRTLARRRQKVANYEAQAERARYYRHYVLYEMVPEEWHQFEILEDQRYRDFASRIYHAAM